MAELEAEAAQFDSDLELSDEEDYTEDYNEDWENDEQDEDEEEIERHEEAAHTVYPYTPLNSFIDANGNTITNLAPHPAGSLVERMREAVRYETNRQSMIELIDDTE